MDGLNFAKGTRNTSNSPASYLRMSSTIALFAFGVCFVGNPILVWICEERQKKEVVSYHTKIQKQNIMFSLDQKMPGFHVSGQPFPWPDLLSRIKSVPEVSMTL